MKNKEKKEYNISFRCKESDYIYIKNHAQKRNTTISEYLLENHVPSQSRKKISKQYIGNIVLLTQVVNDITGQIQQSSDSQNEDMLLLVQSLNKEVKKIWEI